MTARAPSGLLASLPGFGKRFGSIIVLFVVWEAVAQFNLVDPFLLPALSDILRLSVTEFIQGDLGQLVLNTLYRTVAGFLMVLWFGIFDSTKIFGAALACVVTFIWPA